MAEARPSVPMETQKLRSSRKKSDVRFGSSNPYIGNDIHQNTEQEDATWHKNMPIRSHHAQHGFGKQFFVGDGPAGTDEVESMCNQNYWNNLPLQGVTLFAALHKGQWHREARG